VKCQSPSTYQSKDIAMVFLVDDRMTDRTKTICLKIFDLGGIQIMNRNVYINNFSIYMIYTISIKHLQFLLLNLNFVPVRLCTHSRAH
jgi:hypothetical protein